MTLRIFANLSSMRLPSQQLGLSTTGSRTFERLSSGQRVTETASDVAIRSALKRDMRIATAALTNASTGVSVAMLADKALSDVSELLKRMYDIADRSANEGLLSNEDRSLMQREFSAAAGQIQEIATTTRYNGINLLSGGANVVFQVGMDASRASGITMSAAASDLSALGLADSATGAQTYSVTDQAASKTATDAVRAAMDEIKTQRSSFTSIEDRLQVSIANLSSARETMEVAAGNLSNISGAEESAEKTRSQVIQEAGAALLAQANQEPLSVGKLLEGYSPQDSNTRQGIQATSGANLGNTLYSQKDSSQEAKIREDLTKKIS